MLKDRLQNVPTERYYSRAFYDLEIERAFKRAWLAVGRESEIPKPGDFFTFDQVGESLIVVRTAEGGVRAFHNMCSHRGTRLLQKTGNCKAIRCPYHDWKYNLDGVLKHVPTPEGFGGIDKSRLGLKQARADVWGGFVWVCFDSETPPLMEFLGEIPKLLEPYRLEQMRPFKIRPYPLDCNWKAVQDNATECYHHAFVHKSSLAGHMDANNLEFTDLGDHYRLGMVIANYGWRKKLDDWCMPKGMEFTQEQKESIHKYLIFPNTLLNVLPTSLTVFTMWPLSPSSCRLDYGFYTRAGESLLSKARNAVTLQISKILLDEDIAILNRFQKGVECPHQERHLMHKFEKGIVHFNKILSQYIEKPQGRH